MVQFKKAVVVLLLIACTSFKSESIKKRYWLAACVMEGAGAYDYLGARVIDAPDKNTARKIFITFLTNNPQLKGTKFKPGESLYLEELFDRNILKAK